MMSCINAGVVSEAKETLCKPDPKDLMDALYHTVADKWEHIGIYLHLPMATLRTIAIEHQQDPSSQVPHWDAAGVAEESGPSPHLVCHH